jgi:CheY-like chemotaxis protein
MPREDGYSLIRKLRAWELLHKQNPVPAIALTAFVRDSDRSRALKAGFQFHVPKPVEPDDFVAAVAGLARSRARE